MATATIHDLDHASLLGTILDFLPGHFRFVASVNRRFRFLYNQQHTPNTTFYVAAMTSAATRGIWLAEDQTKARKNGCRIAAKCGNLEALRWFHSHRCRWNRDVCRAAAADVCRAAVAEGHLHILQWARSQTPPFPWDQWVCNWAAGNGRLDVLQWLRSQTPPCPWGKGTCIEAARCGRVDMLQWLRSQTPPCPWGKGPCEWAARNGNLDMMQWLRSQTPPCPWNELACEWAARNGNLDVLQWLRSQTPPCPWNIEVCLRYTRRGSDMDVFIRSQL